LRPRLGALRPPRPLTLPRLLFRPLDPLIVDEGAWKEGEGTLPRPVLVPLTRLFAATLAPEQHASLQAALAAHHFNETSVVEAIGERLWPLAGRFFRGLGEVPPEALPPGMSPSQGLACARLAGFFLEERPAFERVAKLLREGGGEEALHPLLRSALYHGPATFLGAMRWLRTRCPLGGTSAVFAVLGDLLPHSEATREQRAVIAAYVRRLQEEILAFIADPAKEEACGERITGLARRIRDTAAVLRGLEVCRKKNNAFASLNERGLDPPALLKRLDDACHALVETLLRRRILEREEEAETTPRAAEREADLLAILELEEAGRLLAASGADYDHLLKETRAAVEEGRGALGRLGSAARTRLLELLAGPEAAYAFFTRESAPAPSAQAAPFRFTF
jgi:hypothetical protein